MRAARTHARHGSLAARQLRVDEAQWREFLLSRTFAVAMRGDCKSTLMKRSQLIKFVELILLNTRVRKLAQFHDRCISENAAVKVTREMAKEEAALFKACSDAWTAREKLKRAHVWSIAGISRFSKSLGRARNKPSGKPPLQKGKREQHGS